MSNFTRVGCPEEVPELTNMPSCKTIKGVDYCAYRMLMGVGGWPQSDFPKRCKCTKDGAIAPREEGTERATINGGMQPVLEYREM